MLLVQTPNAEEFFLSYRLVLQMLDDGFNSAEFLHANGRIASAWTPDYQGPESVRVLQRLVEAGFDRITTNTTPLWMEAIARENQRRENGHGTNGHH